MPCKQSTAYRKGIILAITWKYEGNSETGRINPEKKICGAIMIGLNRIILN